MLIKRVTTVKQEFLNPENEFFVYNNIKYNRGDPIGIKGEKGVFRFWSHSVSKTNGKDVVTVWWENHCFRSFYSDRIGKRKKIKDNALCYDHPTYGGKRRPRTNCEICWQAYDNLQVKKDSTLAKKEVKKSKKVGGLVLQKVEGDL